MQANHKVNNKGPTSQNTFLSKGNCAQWKEIQIPYYDVGWGEGHSAKLAFRVLTSNRETIMERELKGLQKRGREWWAALFYMLLVSCHIPVSQHYWSKCRPSAKWTKGPYSFNGTSTAFPAAFFLNFFLEKIDLYLYIDISTRWVRSASMLLVHDQCLQYPFQFLFIVKVNSDAQILNRLPDNFLIKTKKGLPR